MSVKSFFVKNWIHFVVLAIFFIAMFAYFAPQFDGYGLKQHDVEQFKGMSNETKHFREQTGEEPLWTNSMFGGMPTTQISVIYKGNIFKRIISGFVSWFPSPAGTFLLHLIGFYILTLCLRIKPLIGALGAFAFALSTYEILILQAGHNSKAIAVALMAPVLGAFIMAYRRNWKWGVILSALFMTLELSVNHLQVTYYLGILLFFIGLYELIDAIRAKKLKQFGITSLGIIGGFLLAFLINYGNISLTNDYAKHTIRGANDLTINPDGSSMDNTGGLDKDYITTWSYGIGESATLLSPYVKGSNSNILANMPFRDMLDASDRTLTEQKQILEAAYMTRDQRGGVSARPYLLYWGDQPMTGGPFYLGAGVLFLGFLGLFFLKDRIKWVLFGVALLAVMLSWGKNFMGFTDFFIDYIPGYNKFRTVTIVLVLVELCIPVLGVMFLQKLYETRGELKEEKKRFLIFSACFMLFILTIKFVGLGDNFMSKEETTSMQNLEELVEQQLYSTDPKELASYGIDVANREQMQSVIDAQVESFEAANIGMRSFREDVFSSSMNRSLVVAFFTIGFVALFFFTSLNSYVIVGGLILVVLADLVPVDRIYLGSETDNRGDFLHWRPAPEVAYPLSSLAEDIQVMDAEIKENPKLEAIIKKGEKKGELKAEELGYVGKDKRRVIDSYKFAALNQNTNYRVFDIAGSWQSSRASYFHKSLGGYHGAKLRNIQNLFDFHISRSNNNIFDMLNVKYILQGGQAQRNPSAMGNAWLVKTVKQLDTPNDEIQSLGSKFHLKNLGKGQLFVNGDRLMDADVFGGEELLYITNEDTLDVPLSNGLTAGLKAIFVKDIRGTTNLIPEATLNLDTANSFIAMVEIELTDDFNPEKEAVMLHSEAKKLSTSSFSGEGTISLTAYAPNRLEYVAKDLNGKQLVVFSEIYYKDGWKAFVDGKEQEILKVNYLLRGLELKGGDHKILFTFDLPKYRTANTLAMVGSLVLIFLLFGMAFIDYRDTKKEKAA